MFVYINRKAIPFQKNKIK